MGILKKLMLYYFIEYQSTLILKEKEKKTYETTCQKKRLMRYFWLRHNANVKEHIMLFPPYKILINLVNIKK